MCERYARISGGGNARGNAGDDFPEDACIDERFGFFAAAPEDERVAAFEPRHGFAGARLLDEYTVNLLLRSRGLAGALAHINQFSAAPRITERFGVDEIVVNDHVGGG